MDDLTETRATMESSQEMTGQDVEFLVPGEGRVPEPGASRSAAKHRSEAEGIATKSQPGQMPVVDDPADQEDWFESVSREEGSKTSRQCCQMTYFGSHR